ncbi:hypothetical protein WICMUC_000530 [Wickerhamomyces mucosus]|uniref:Uncharacterized protein n=1 Tax=Wickerhamomyces mucosus TaxID=1378264 RepID=A0A9P8PZK7_9ASCO|nr:hypothetical protein WICMUC_000530 [Wickerhamomyces mucosus]
MKPALTNSTNKSSPICVSSSEFSIVCDHTKVALSFGNGNKAIGPVGCRLKPSIREIFNSLAIGEFFKPAARVKPAGPPPTTKTSTTFGSNDFGAESTAYAKALLKIKDILLVFSQLVILVCFIVSIMI